MKYLLPHIMLSTSIGLGNLGGCSLGGCKAPPIGQNQQESYQEHYKTRAYDSAVIYSNVANRIGISDMKGKISLNIQYLLEKITSRIGIDLVICGDYIRCSGNILEIRFVEDNYLPYITDSILMGSRLEGYVVISDVKSDTILYSHRINRSRTYRDLFSKIRNVLGQSLIDLTLDPKIYHDFSDIPSIKPELDAVL